MEYAEQLRQDHEDIRTMLAILVEVSNRLEAGSTVSADDIEKILRFLEVFVVQVHGIKEAQLLHPALEEAGIKREGGPIAVIDAETQIGENFLNGMRDALARYAAGDRTSGHIAAEYARNYVSLMSQQLEQEDEVILPVADQRLPDERKELLAKQFDELETAAMGPKRHEEFHALAHELAESYLN